VRIGKAVLFGGFFCKFERRQVQVLIRTTTDVDFREETRAGGSFRPEFLRLDEVEWESHGSPRVPSRDHSVSNFEIGLCVDALNSNQRSPRLTFGRDLALEFSPDDVECTLDLCAIG